MAGFLDFLNSDDAALGLGLLAAGGPSTVPMSFGQRLAQGVDYGRQRRDASIDRQFKQQLMKSQIDENAGQAELRKAQIAKLQRDADFDAQFFGGGGGLLGGGTAGAASASTPAAGGGGGGPAGAPGPQAVGGMSAAQISQRYGIPIEQVLADYRWNGGKKIAEFIDSRTKPDWTVVNGFRFNKNDPGSTTGFMPGITTSANGQTTVTGVDPRTGAPYAYAAPGSADAAAAFVDATERAKAPYAPGKGRIGASGRSEPTSVAEDLGIVAPRGAPPVLPGRPLGAPGPVSAGLPTAQPGMSGAFMAGRDGKVDVDRAMMAIQSIGDPQDKANAMAGLQRQIAAESSGAPAAGITLPGRPLGAPAPAPTSPEGSGIGVAGGTDFSPAEKAVQEAQRTRLVKGAEAQAEADASATKTANEAERAKAVDEAKQKVAQAPDKQKAIIAANDAMRAVDEALVHPGLSTATGLSSKVNPKNYIPGTDAYNFKVRSEQLKGTVFRSAYEALKGAGQVTELEGTKAENAIARMDRAQSTDEYRKALEDYREFLKRAIATAGGTPPGGGGNRSTFEALPSASQYKGRSIRDTATGKLLRSDGMSWKPAE
jgi:hypothetical protein